ncbi:site-specific DNA-methyltransferase [Acinetobacter johnsonii]|uniref:site-specific DNA-methyltransferase n=1 Tax=Acinetobacter johnsonii TaxID=40214 RepID=UPI001F2CED89|nr:site-specific DNA-methyltransferase [Acinetobacter johnsonii]UIZ94561.1 site-specific DNA-methyltransferase [Acinetobacter johnsonii]
MKTEQTLSTEVVTANSEQLAVLKSNFPQCFDRQGKFILSKLQDILQADGVDLSRESYSLNWLGKSYARVLANEPIRTMLSEDYEHNQLEQNKNSHNLLIKGDNLEVLKHLKGAYTDKIKMIYIDPPYNTGSDGFVYQDDRSFTPEQFAELAGVDFDEAHRILDFTQSNANSHSAWLTFIYPRLYIAKQLLKDDGVIFISIDDNEQAQLKILCDDIFGEANFVADLSVVNNLKGRNDKKYIARTNERLLMYVKSQDFSEYGLPLDESTLAEYKYTDGSGRYRLIELRKRGGADTQQERPKMYYPFFVNPDTGRVSLQKSEEFNTITHPVKSNGVNGRWRWGSETAQKNIDFLIAVEVGNKYNVYEKDYYESDEGARRIKPKSVLSGAAYSTDVATKEYRAIMGETFISPKPVAMLKDLITYATNPKENAIVLDFFAGSGTTAHALLKQNIEDGGNRKFICVQLPEEIEQSKEAYKVGYRTIFDITKDRIIKTSEKLAQDYPESYFEQGFKVFKTCESFLPSSNYRELKQLTLSQADTPPSTTGFDDAQLQDVLITWKGTDKILLSENLNTINLGNYIAYGFGHVLYLVNQGFNTSALKELIKKLDDEHEFQVSKLVIFGHHFDSKSQREIDEAMRNYNNKKSIPVDVVVRY